MSHRLTIQEAMLKAAVQPQGNNTCVYCGAENPDSEEKCPQGNGARHTLVSHSDKQDMGMGFGPGPGARTSKFSQVLDLLNFSRGIDKEAHGFDPGDDSVVRHCPFCGSGKIWGKSDGNIQCEFCGKNYTVQVQPEFPQAAQNLNGVPLGMDGVDGSFDEEGNPIQPAGDEDAELEDGEDAGMAPDGAPGASEGGMMPDGGDDEEGSPEDEEDQGKNSEDEEDDDDEPPFLKKKTSLDVEGAFKGWPHGGALDRHFTTSVDGGGHGWSKQQLKAMSGPWRQWRHQLAHGLGPQDDPILGSVHDPGHEHWTDGDEDHDEARSLQRYREVEAHEASFYMTAAGDVLNTDDMINHLAIRHASNRGEMAKAVRDFNRSRNDS